VALVQPVLAAGLVFSLVLGALVDRNHADRPLPDRAQWVSALTVVAGLATFLVAAKPTPGRATGRPGVLLAVTIGTLLVIVGAWWWSHRPGAPHRALVLGLAAGCGFGVTGVLLKEVVASPPSSWWHSWPLAALLLVGALSFPTAQLAYRAGALIESLPTMTVLEPVVAVAVAALAFGESLAGGWAARAGVVVGLVLVTAGVISLARSQAAQLPTAAPGQGATVDR
jgi:hypothetical protein